MSRPLTAAFDERPCRCVKHHRPVPLITEQHHVFPAGVQEELFGRVRDRELLPLCASSHRNLHRVLDRLLAGEDVDERSVNPYVYRWAEEGYRRITAARRGNFPDEGVRDGE